MSSNYTDALNVYNQVGQDWIDARRSTTVYEIKYLDWILSNLTKKSEILDLGCGFGWPIAEYFSHRGHKVTGVDGSSTLLNEAKKNYPSQVWIEEDMRYINLNQKFDAVIAWDSFFHLSQSDQEKMFPVFCKHMKPGALLLFTSGHERGEAIGNLSGEKLYHASLDPDDYRRLFAANKLEEVAYTEKDGECGERNVWQARAV